MKAVFFFSDESRLSWTGKASFSCLKKIERGSVLDRSVRVRQHRTLNYLPVWPAQARAFRVRSSPRNPSQHPRLVFKLRGHDIRFFAIDMTQTRFDWSVAAFQRDLDDGCDMMRLRAETAGVV